MEVAEISSLSKEEVYRLVERGFVDLLRINFPDDTLTAWQEHIHHITLGYAQPVQEYCEQLGYIAEEAGWKASTQMLNRADAVWLGKA